MFICEIFMVILFDAAMFILILRLAHSMEEKNVKARMICITMGLGFLCLLYTSVRRYAGV